MKHYGRKDGVKYENRAVGATTTAANLPMLPMLVADTMEGSANHTRGVDMVFVDFSINDESVSNDVLRIKNASFLRCEKVLAATEAAVRYILEFHPDTAILLMDGGCRSHKANAAHQAVASLYGIAYVRKCTPGFHFSASEHETVKESMVEWWNVFEKAVTDVKLRGSVTSDTQLPSPPRDPITPANLAACFVVCAKPLTVYDAKDAYFGNGSAPTVIKGDWSLELDRNRTDKASWTSYIDKSVVNFPLKFGKIPQIAIVFTKGYDDTFGAVKVTMLGTSLTRTILQGCCDPNNVTQSELRILHVGEAPRFRRLSDITRNSREGYQERYRLLPHSSVTMQVTFLKESYSKFSIKHVASC